MAGGVSSGCSQSTGDFEVCLVKLTLSPEDVVIMLGEPVRLIADVLQ